MPRARLHGLLLLKPELGSRPTFQVNTRSLVVTGCPSDHFRSGFSLIVTAMPLLPSGWSSSFASPFSASGSSAQSRQAVFQSLSCVVIGRSANATT